MAEGFVMPTRAQVNRYQQSNVNAARLGVANAKVDKKNANKTPQSILDYRALIASMPSSAGIGAAYDSTFAGLGSELAALNTGKGGSDVSAFVNALGTGTGATAGNTSVAATTAGTTSNNDAALLASMAADFGRAKSADMKDMLGQRMNVTSSLVGAEDTFAQNKMAARDRLAQARQAYATSRPDPLASANNWLSLLTNKANFDKIGSSGGSSGVDTTQNSPEQNGPAHAPGAAPTAQAWRQYYQNSQHGLNPGQVYPYDSKGKLKPGRNPDGTKKK